MSLESHNETRKNLPLWRENMINVLLVLRNSCKLGEYFTDEEVHTVRNRLTLINKEMIKLNVQNICILLHTGLRNFGSKFL